MQEFISECLMALTVNVAQKKGIKGGETLQRRNQQNLMTGYREPKKGKRQNNFKLLNVVV